MIAYKVKGNVNLFETLPLFGYIYNGNYNRGDGWVKKMEGIDKYQPLNGIAIHGDWDRRRITFQFPYRLKTNEINISSFIQDLISANLIEQECL